MLLHGHTGLSRIMRTNRPINFAVHLRGFLQIHSIYNRLAAVFIEVSGDGLHQCAKDRVSRRASNRPMKAHVVDKVLMRIGERRIHLRNLLSKLGDMLISCALSGQRSDIGLKNEAGLKHLPRKETMQRSENRKRAGIKRRRTRRDECPSAVSALENTHCREKTNAGAKAGAADRELAGTLR